MDCEEPSLQPYMYEPVAEALVMMDATSTESEPAANINISEWYVLCLNDLL